MKNLHHILSLLPTMVGLLGVLFLLSSFTVPSHITARFTQTRHSAMLTEDQVLTGRFSYDTPDKVVWKYDAGIEARLPKEMLSFISKSVSGEYLSDNAEFAVTIDGNTAVLTPKRRQLKQFFREIRILFNQKTGLAQQVILCEPTDDVTTIVFSSMQAK